MTAVLASTLLLAGSLSATAAGPERADVWDQGGATVYAPDGARLVRQANGIAVSVKMPTPESGEYLYPDGTEPGHPEVFTLWMFVFNYPEHCAGPCGPDDMTNPAVEFGVVQPRRTRRRRLMVDSGWPGRGGRPRRCPTGDRAARPVEPGRRRGASGGDIARPARPSDLAGRVPSPDRLGSLRMLVGRDLRLT